MPKKYFQLKDIDIPLYKGVFVPVITNDRKKLSKLLPDFDFELLFAHALFENRKEREGYYLVLNFNNQDGKITHGVIAHEAIHIVDMLSANRGFLEVGADEPRGYLMEWLTNEVYKFINEVGFNKKVK